MSQNKYNERVARIVSELKEIAEKLGVHPTEVSKVKFLKYAQNVTPWDIHEVGGLGSIKSAHFPVVTKDLVVIREQKEAGKYIRDLEKQLAEREFFEATLLDQIAKNLKPIEIRTKKIEPKKQKKIREIVVSLNDTHYGLLVDKDEVGGVNQFGWKEACRRTAFLAKQVNEYKIESRHEVRKLHIILAGDLLQGVIHDLTARTAELMIHQVNGALHILGNFVASVAQHYPEIEVHCVAGNHDDMPHRREGGRVTSHKYDSFVNMVYFSLSATFSHNKNIKFNITKGLSVDVNLPSGRLLVTHGDTLFGKSLGNPSSNLQTRRLGDAINRYNTGEIINGKAPIKMVLVGHVHSYSDFVTFDGVRVLIAPSLSGVDAYAASLGININTIGQVIFESTEDHILGDSRLVNLQEADNDETLDQIIPIFENQLAWK